MRLYLSPAVIEYDRELEKEVLKTSDLYEASYFITKGCTFEDIRVIYTGAKAFYVQVYLSSVDLVKLYEEFKAEKGEVSFSRFMDVYRDLQLFFINLKRQARETRRAGERGLTFTRSICKAGRGDL